MSLIAPYATGLWLAEYLNIRCQLCRIYRSVPQSQLGVESPLSTHATHDSTTNDGTRYDPANPSNTINRSNTTSTANSKQSPYNSAHRRLNSLLQSSLLCSHCHHSIAWLPPLFQVDIAAGITLPIQAATYYDYPMRQAIRAFKHQEDMTKLPLLVHALRQLPRPRGCHSTNSVIVPMPTTQQRLVKRGFDPVSILSAQLSKHWQIPLWQGVARIDNTISQQGLTRAERLGNVDNAFAVMSTPPVKRVLLFDDVATTGASLQALGRSLGEQSNLSGLQVENELSRYQIFAFTLAHGSQ